MGKSVATVHPCIGDSPVWEWAVPPRVWNTSHQIAKQLEVAENPSELQKEYLKFALKPGHRVRVTVGEMHAAVNAAYNDPDISM
jgi:hypothetical protein